MAKFKILGDNNVELHEENFKLAAQIWAGKYTAQADAGGHNEIVVRDPSGVAVWEWLRDLPAAIETPIEIKEDFL